MSQSLRIAVADDDPEMRAFYERFLPLLGHRVASVAEDGARLMEQCRQARPDLVIADIRMPGVGGLDAVEAIRREADVPVILVTGHDDADLLRRAEAAGVYSYLLKPITEKDLGPAIALAYRQFEQFRALRKEADELRQSLEDRKLIERAKGVVTRRLGVQEAEAYRRMRHLSGARNRKLVDIAQNILTSEEIFQALEDV